MRRNISFRDVVVFRHKADSEFIEYLMARCRLDDGLVDGLPDLSPLSLLFPFLLLSSPLPENFFEVRAEKLRRPSI